MRKILFIISFIISCALIVLFPTAFMYDNLDDIGIRCCVYFMFFLISSVITYATFNWYTNKYPLNMDKHMKKFDVFKAIKMTNGQKSITFIREESKFICEDRSFSKVIIDLKGYMFKKAYIASYVTRNIRYKEVSEKRAFFNNFFKKRLDLSVMDDLDLIIIDNDKKYSKKLVENSCSKISILNKFILGSKHAKQIVIPATKRGDMAKIAERNRTVYGINEEVYQSGYFGFYKTDYSKPKKKKKRRYKR